MVIVSLIGRYGCGRCVLQKLEHLRQRAGDDAEVRWHARVTRRRKNGAAGAGKTNDRSTAAPHAAQVRTPRRIVIMLLIAECEMKFSCLKL